MKYCWVLGHIISGWEIVTSSVPLQPLARGKGRGEGLPKELLDSDVTWMNWRQTAKPQWRNYDRVTLHPCATPFTQIHSLLSMLKSLSLPLSLFLSPSHLFCLLGTLMHGSSWNDQNTNLQEDNFSLLLLLGRAWSCHDNRNGWPLAVWWWFGVSSFHLY